MAKFVFKLEGVLRQRKHVEEQRQRELAVIRGEMAQLEAELNALNAQVTAASIDVRDNRLIGKLDMSFLAAHRRFLLAMQRRGLTMMQKMALVQRQIEEAQANLAEAAKQRKIIEKLREKQHQRWLEESSRKEQALMDEISMQMSFRNSLDQAEPAL